MLIKQPKLHTCTTQQLHEVALTVGYIDSMEEEKILLSTNHECQYTYRVRMC